MLPAHLLCSSLLTTQVPPGSPSVLSGVTLHYIIALDVNGLYPGSVPSQGSLNAILAATGVNTADALLLSAASIAPTLCSVTFPSNVSACVCVCFSSGLYVCVVGFMMVVRGCSPVSWRCTRLALFNRQEGLLRLPLLLPSHPLRPRLSFSSWPLCLVSSSSCPSSRWALGSAPAVNTVH